ncbi:MAG: hypothetical protein ACPGUD_10380 [Parashewanella sp.]
MVHFGKIYTQDIQEKKLRFDGTALIKPSTEGEGCLIIECEKTQAINKYTVVKHGSKINVRKEGSIYWALSFFFGYKSDSAKQLEAHLIVSLDSMKQPKSMLKSKPTTVYNEQARKLVPRSMRQITQRVNNSLTELDKQVAQGKLAKVEGRNITEAEQVSTSDSE